MITAPSFMHRGVEWLIVTKCIKPGYYKFFVQYCRERKKTMQKDKYGDNADDGEDEVKVEITVPRREREYDPPPPPPRTRDESSHHSSPHPSDVQQTPEFKQMPKIGQSEKGQREITGGAPRKVDVPMHVTKHPEPRGRPRQTEASQDDYED